MTAQEVVPVAIVGGGPVGLALALGLAHHGVRCLVIEKEADPVRESRAFGTWTRTLEIFADWGVLDPILQTGSLVDRLEPVDGASERRLFSARFAELEEETAIQGVLLAPQNQTERVLRSLVEANPRCALVVGECTQLDEEESRVRVGLRGPEGNIRSVLANYVVGCDGAHSFVRNAIGLNLEGSTYPTRMVLCDEVITGPELAPLRFDLRDQGFLASVRFGSDLWRVMATVPEEMSDDEALAPRQIDARVRALFGDRAHRTIWQSQFHLYRRHAARFRRGRVLLAGDAAHLVSPAGGQGMNSGIQDAENLAWTLAECLRGHDAERLLHGYDVERRQVLVEDVSERAETNTRFEFGMPPGLKPWLLRALDLALHVPPIEHHLLRRFSMLDLSYDAGLSPRLVPGHAAVGQRFPDVRLPSGERLSAGLRGRAAFVAVGDAVRDFSIPIPLVHVGHAPKGMRIPNGALVLLRADRHVGAVLRTPNEDEIARTLDHCLGGRSPSDRSIAR